MHTPRFSGHPSSAGDFVFVRICSRPYRTNCENVGTLPPRSEKSVSCFCAAQTFPRRTLRVNEQKRSPTRRNYQVLRPDASPRGVNCICELRRGSHGFAGLAPHFGRSFLPRSVFLCSGSEILPFHHRARRPLHNRASIGKTTKRVNPISLWKSDKYDRSSPESSLIRRPETFAKV